ncbi:MAG: hypothetical protein II710_05815, partial [Clostridia bacterium]|nr:hypothetical protein [Clostridia bacterium]
MIGIIGVLAQFRVGVIEHGASTRFLFRQGHLIRVVIFPTVIIAIVLGLVYQGKAAMFRGIAEASETIISVPSATE